MDNEYNSKLDEFLDIKAEKVDQGFELMFRNLSNRRKFIRALWVTSLWIIVVLSSMFFRGMADLDTVHLVVVLAILLLGCFRTVWYYSLWKNEVRQNNKI